LLFLIWQLETGTQETIHVQGYLRLKAPTSFTALKTCLTWLQRAHIEQCGGSEQANIEYCSKEETRIEGPYEVGQRSVQGKRTDLIAAVEDLQAGVSEREMWYTHPSVMVRYTAGMNRAREIYNARPSPPTYRLDQFQWNLDLDFSKSIILWGDSGIGKTCYAHALLPNALIISHIDDLRKYSSGEYDGIIFDDMSFNHMPRESQIHLTDIDFDRSIHCRYQTALIPANTKKIFTTNNFNGNIFLDDPAIRRRTKVIHLIKDL
jgi:hypothetical protein